MNEFDIVKELKERYNLTDEQIETFLKDDALVAFCDYSAPELHWDLPPRVPESKRGYEVFTSTQLTRLMDSKIKIKF